MHGCARSPRCCLSAQATAGLERIRAEVGPQLKDKLVFVGWNATGQLADVLPTIYGARTPGVFTHAVVADMMLQGRSRMALPDWSGLAVGLVLALIAALLVASTGALVAAASVLAMAGMWLWGRASWRLTRLTRSSRWSFQ